MNNPAKSGCGRRVVLGGAFAVLCLAINISGAEIEEDPLDLRALMEMKVTSVSRKAEPWFFAPAAIEVLTQEEIRRYGATTIPDTLRIVPGLHVARSSGNSYAVTTRGFSSLAGNKMQVLMDGRSLYTPLFSGVFWEVQDTLLPDLERIEVIRGPGAALWGANAVNGVINLTSKDARDTLGTLIEAGGGNEEVGFGAVRYGGKIGESSYYRVYTKYRYRDEQIFSSGVESQDFSEHWQSGFRSDTFLRDVHQLTLQGDLYLNDFGSFGRSDSHARGGNILGRWTRTFSDSSDFQFQLFYDRTEREIPLQFEEERNTFDADFQHRFQAGERNDFVWGVSYRVSADQTGNDGTYFFEPADRTIQWVTGFLQDEITIIPDLLSAVLGTKVEHNDFAGTEIQPSGRLSLTPGSSQLIWAAISRAVRTPTRLESDVRFRPSPSLPLATLVGNPDFDSEDLLAYEVGYRIRPFRSTTFDVSLFYNDYENLRTIEPSPGGIFLTLQNERHGNTYGFETSIRHEVAEAWHLMAGYSLLREDLEFTKVSRDPTGGTSEVNDPRHMVRFRSSFTLPHRIEFDQVVRYVDSLPNPHLPSYTELDLRLGWRPIPGLELSIVGMNLLDSAHPEFANSSLLQPEVQRSVYGKVLWLF